MAHPMRAMILSNGPGLHWKRHGTASCSFKVISFSNINKQYGKQLLFVDASFQLNPSEKVGLVGPNGSGKTTLFRMVVGEETPDEGAVSVPKKLTIGYFRQDVEEMQGRSVLDEAIAESGRVGDLHHELEALQRVIASVTFRGAPVSALHFPDSVFPEKEFEAYWPAANPPRWAIVMRRNLWGLTGVSLMRTS